MELSDIIEPDGILANLKSGSKKQLLQDLALAGTKYCSFDQNEIFDALAQRERLGSTGVGNGVAIPHAKLPGIERICGVFARLNKPVAYDAIDDQPVDLVFVLLAPEGAGADHLKALSRIARVLRNQSTLANLRNSNDPDAIYSLLTSTESANAA